MSSDGNIVSLTQDEMNNAIRIAFNEKVIRNQDKIIIGLDPEEKQQAIEKALDYKRGLINLKLYQDSLFNPSSIQKRTLTAEELYFTAIRIGKSMIEKDNEETGKKNTWWLTPEEKQIYGLLALYFARDARFESKGKNFSLKKGLLLYGNVGCGKTTALEIFRTLSDPTFPIKPCERVVREYGDKETGGGRIIDKYIKYTSICFDDFGTESAAKQWGNESNVIREILNGRYDKEKHSRFVTHMTTNISADQFEEWYGIRLRDRARQMFNKIEFPTNSISKRI